jgi:hypothetical protein
VSKEPKPTRPTWYLFTPAKPPPEGQIVLVTSDPAGDDPGVPAMWYRRRRSEGGRWVPFQTWVDPVSHRDLIQQPTHWRVDPARSDWRLAPVA